ncbi:hypothetical protein ABIA30_002335 [Mycobacterium sp. MAA66]|uniref:hypothetical protein n=1 Tax=Mycobacterium sp. MAA66 TaxID=3156297 RepID=UPI003512E67B
MRFDEFAQRHNLAISPIDRFDRFVVEVGVPQGWYPFDSATGMRIWACRSDPRIDVFCANAVLITHRVEAKLDAHEVFAMLSEQQLESVQCAYEQRRTLSAATEGPGVVGVLAMQINDKLGVLDSLTRTRIITNPKETMIAQLTVTALQDSPANRANIWLTVRLRDDGSPTAPILYSGGPDTDAWRDHR